MKMRNEEDFFQWLNTKATEGERILVHRVVNFSDLFEDMLFARGTDSYYLTQYQAKCNDGMWHNVSDSLRPELEDFDYGWFNYKTEPLEERFAGCYNHKEMLLCAPPDAED